MANRFYVGSDGDWNTDANWSDTSNGSGGSSFPTASDDVFFDDHSGNCTLDANAACNSLTIGTASDELYAGTLDLNGHDFDIGTGGLDCTYGTSATIDAGEGTITCSGDWDYQDIGNFHDRTSTVVFDGTLSIYAVTDPNKSLYNVTIAEGASVTVENTGGVFLIAGVLSVEGTLNGNRRVQPFSSTSEVKIYSTATITLASGVDIFFYGPGAGQGITVFESGATITGDGYVHYYTSILGANPVLAPGTYDIDFRFMHRGIDFQAGAYQFNKDVLFDDNSNTDDCDWDLSAATSLTIDGDLTIFCDGAGDDVLTLPDCGLTLEGDLHITESAGSFTWTAGNGDLTLTNTNDQTITTPAGWDNELEDIVITKDSGTITLAGPLTCQSLDLQSGAATLDFGSDSHTISGDATFDGSGEVDCGDATITVGGNFDNKDQGTWTRDTSTVVLDGTSKTITGSISKPLYNLTIDTGASISTHADTNTLVYITNTLKVYGDLEVVNDNWQTKDLEVYSAATLTISTYRTLSCYNGSLTTFEAGGTITGDGALGFDQGAVAAKTIAAGTFDVKVVLLKRDLTFSAGAFQFNKNLIIRDLNNTSNSTWDLTAATSFTVDGDLTVESTGSSQNELKLPDCGLTLEGDLTITESAGTLIWTAGNGDLTLTNTNNQTITIPAGWSDELEAIHVTKDTGTIDLAGPLTCKGLYIDSGASTFDFVDQNVTLGDEGLDCTGGGSATLDAGTSSVSCAGDWDTEDLSDFDSSTSTVTLTGTNNLKHKTESQHRLSTLVIDGDITVAHAIGTAVTNTLTVNNGKSVTIAGNLALQADTAINVSGTITNNTTASAGVRAMSGDVTIENTGVVNGTGEFYVFNGDIDNSNGGEISVGTQLRYYVAGNPHYLSEGTYDCDVLIRSYHTGGVLTLGKTADQTVTFNNPVTIQADAGETLEIKNDTHDTNIVFGDDVTLVEENGTGTLTWTAGEGTITFSGSNDQTVTTPAGWSDELEDIVITKDSGTIDLAGPLTCQSLDLQSGAATLDFNDQDVTVSGDMTFDGTGEVDCGDSTITCSGNFDNQNQSTWTYGTSEVVLDGTSKELLGNSANDFYDLTLSGNGITVSALSVSRVEVRRNLSLTGTVTVNSDVRTGTGGTGTCDVAGGTIDGSAKVDDRSLTGTWTGAVTSWSISAVCYRSTTFNATGTFGGTWQFLNPYTTQRVVEFGSGGQTFTGDVYFESSAADGLEIANDHNDPSLTFEGDLNLSQSAGTLTWTAGDGTITFSGSEDQTITTSAGFTDELEDITIDKVADIDLVRLAGNVATQSFTGTQGRFDLDGNTVTSSGNVDIDTTGGFQFHNGGTAGDDTDFSMGDGKFAINSGSLALDGTDGTHLEIHDLDFELAAGVSGVATYCDVQDSIGTGDGVPIDATHATNTKIGGDTTGWNFDAGTEISCELGTIVLAPLNASIDASTQLACTMGTIVVAGLDGEITQDTTVHCTLPAVVIAGLNGEVTAATVVSCSLGTLAIAPLNGEVTIGENMAITHPAGNWHNAAETQIDFRGDSPLAPWATHKHLGYWTGDGAQDTGIDVASLIGANCTTKLSLYVRLANKSDATASTSILDMTDGSVRTLVRLYDTAGTDGAYWALWQASSQINLYTATWQVYDWDWHDFFVVLNGDTATGYVNGVRGNVTELPDGPTDLTSLTGAHLFASYSGSAGYCDSSIARVILSSSLETPVSILTSSNRFLDIGFDVQSTLIDLTGNLAASAATAGWTTDNYLSVPDSYQFRDALPYGMTKEEVATPPREHHYQILARV